MGAICGSQNHRGRIRVNGAQGKGFTVKNDRKNFKKPVKTPPKP